MSGEFDQNYDRQVEAIKRPPNSLEAEKSVLGGLLLDNDSFEKIEEILEAKDFYKSEHQVIFKQIARMVEDNQPIDVITLSDALADDGKIDQAGGLHYLIEITKNTPTAANIKSYSKIVKERSKLRHVLNAAVEIADSVYDQQGRNSIQIIDEAEQRIMSIAEDSVSEQSGPELVRDVLPNVVNKLDLLMDVKGGITGLSTGFSDLDEQLSGLHPSNLLIVAGRPSMGKTSFAMNIAENVARTATKPVLVFSMEMSSEDLIVRMISSLGKVDQTLLRNGRLDDEHWAKITASMQVLNSNMKMYIDDSPALTPAELRSRARRVAKDNDGLSMIMVDYLQLMNVPGYINNRTQEVSEISRSLKALSKELNVPVIALSQLNRGVDDRADKRPMMSDLRESGAIEQDADVIMFVYRDE
ncbi:MAG: replicative DNA helicase, partial [Francisellaceae bacterium]